MSDHTSLIRSRQEVRIRRYIVRRLWGITGDYSGSSDQGGPSHDVGRALRVRQRHQSDGRVAEYQVGVGRRRVEHAEAGMGELVVLEMV